MAVATPTRPAISLAIDALAELQSARAEQYGDEATESRAISPERAHRLAVLFQRAGGLNGWQLEALLRHAALLEAIDDGLNHGEGEEPAWDDVYRNDQPEVERIERVVHALGFWGDEGICYRPSTDRDAA
jgi:hypothetical protein